MITHRTMAGVLAAAAIERLIEDSIREAVQRRDQRRSDGLRYAVALFQRNGAPVQLYLEDGAGRLELYQIPERPPGAA